MKQKLIEIISKAVKEISSEDVLVEVMKPKEKDNGDYATNVAMKLAGLLHQSPMDVAESIVKSLQDDEIEKVEIKKPGFINFFMKKDYLFANINKVLEEKSNYGRSHMGDGKSINIEFVSANPTGILHLGNARGGAYGDSLARILTFAGFDVTKEYYINDAGSQIDNLGLSILARYQEICKESFEMPANGYYGKEIIAIAEQIYNEFGTSALDKDIEFFKEKGKKELLQHILADLREYRIEYDVLSSEKDIVKKVDAKKIIHILKDNGYTYESEGAIWFKCSDLLDDKDHVLVRSDGSMTYLVPDICYHLDKYQRGYDKMIDILGTDHHGYVARLKSSVMALHNDEKKLDVKLLQLVRLVENGEVVKMSKRTGKSVTLKELMDEVGVNAARYFFSRYSLDTQMDFDLTQAKAKSNENPVYYVCYAYARICSILKEVKKEKDIAKYVALNDDVSYNVLEKVYEFPEIVENAAMKELPHLITNYVYELASLFHLYYSKTRIITDNEEETLERINLIKCVKQTIFNALDLIGVIPPEKM